MLAWAVMTREEAGFRGKKGLRGLMVEACRWQGTATEGTTWKQADGATEQATTTRAIRTFLLMAVVSVIGVSCSAYYIMMSLLVGVTTLATVYI